MPVKKPGIFVLFLAIKTGDEHKSANDASWFSATVKIMPGWIQF